MALRTIVQDGDPILKKVCRPVTSFDDRLATLLDDMKETLLDAGGLGLAGPQVGVMRRLFIALDERDLPEGIRIQKAENQLEVPTCRAAEIPYEKGVNFVTVVDGFLVSANVEATAENIDTDFAYSDHNPVLLRFTLKP